MVYEKYLIQDIFRSVFYSAFFLQPDRNFDYEMKDIVFDIHRPKRLNLLNPELDYNQFPERFQTRFIQLLPSYQLRLFSFTSKQNYYDCLNLRGLECDIITLRISFQEYINRITTTGRLCIDYRNIPQPFLRFLRPIRYVDIFDENYLTEFNVQPIYTNLTIDFNEPSSLQYISKFCHPTLKSVEIELKFHAEVDSLKGILSCLDSVKNLTIEYDPEDEEPMFPPKIAKEILEDWIEKKSIPLKKFYFHYKYLIVLYKNKLFLCKKHLTGYVFITEDFSATNNQVLYECFPLDEKFDLFKHDRIL